LKKVCKTIEELDLIAGEILKSYPEERIFAVSGELGAGKTTLIKSFCRNLGAADAARSPSFAIINEYEIRNPKFEIGNVKIFHFDFYRIKKEEEAFDIGIEEYLYSGNYCFMEWAERIAGLMPAEFVEIRIEAKNDGTRLIEVRS